MSSTLILITVAITVTLSIVHYSLDYPIYRYLGAVRYKYFIAKIMSDLMGQYDNQEFVNKITSTDTLIEELIELRESVYYKKDKNAVFLFSIFVLERGMINLDLDIDTRKTCKALLSERLNKAKNEQAFWHQHFIILEGAQKKTHEFVPNT